DEQMLPTQKRAHTDTKADVSFGNHSAATYSSFAYQAPFVYIECERTGPVALNVNTGTPSFTACATTGGAPDWHSSISPTFGAPIVAGGAVWVVDTSGGTGLYAYDATTGTQ